MSAHHLPYEICQQIFQHLPESNVYQCIFVCKSWNMAATHAYYTNFTLTGDMITFLQRKISLYSSNRIDDLPQLTTQGALVRSLRIDKDRPSRSRLDAKEFVMVLSNMPNIRKIDLNSTTKLRYYLQKLQNSRRNAVDLKHLEDISIVNKYSPPESAGMEDYIQACYKYRKILKYLYLTYIVGRRFYDRDRLPHYIKLLADFTSLTDLQIDNNTMTENLLCPILKNCPNLINFIYNSKYSINNDITVELLSVTSPSATNNTVRGQNTVTNTDESSEDSDIATIGENILTELQIQEKKTYFHDHYCKNLKTVRFSAPYISMKCLMLYVPSQINVFQLRSDENLLDHWFEENDIDTIIQLAEQLCYIGTLDVCMGRSVYFNGYHSMFARPVVIRSLERNITLDQKLNKYWKFIGRLTARRNLKAHFTLNVCGNGRGPTSNDFKFNISQRDNKMELQYKLDFGDCLYDDTAVMDLPSFLPIGTGESSAALVRRNTEVSALHSLDINIEYHGGMYNLRSTDIKVNVISILEYTVLNCHYLTNMSVDVNGVKYQFKYRNNQEPTTTSLSLKNMTHCYLQKVNFSPEISNLLNSTFHNIKMLDLNDCSFSADDYCNYHWDFSGINHLDNLRLDMQNLNTTRQRSYIFFQIDFTNSNGEEDVKYYQFNKTALSGEGLVSTTYKNINSFNRVNSLKTTVFFIKFEKINSITLILQHDVKETMSFN